MFCSKCGAADQSADSYCKRCGEWLPDTTRLGRRRGRIRARTPEQRHQKMRIIEAMSALAARSSAVINLTSEHGENNHGRGERGQRAHSCYDAHLLMPVRRRVLSYAAASCARA